MAKHILVCIIGFLSAVVSGAPLTVVEGENLGAQYDIIEHFNSGTESFVVRAKQVGSSKTTVLKFFKSGFVLSAFRHVAISQMSKNNPFIAQYRGPMAFDDGTVAIEVAEVPALLEDLVEKVRLRSKDGAPNSQNIDLIFRVLNDLVSAAAFLHNLNIVHNDLKPSNVGLTVSVEEFLQGKGHIVLMDFGASFEVHGQDSNLMPAKRYRAPEVITDAASIWSDYYSIGAMLAELMLGSSAMVMDIQTHEQRYMDIVSELSVLQQKLANSDLAIKAKFMQQSEFILSALTHNKNERRHRLLKLRQVSFLGRLRGAFQDHIGDLLACVGIGQRRKLEGSVNALLIRYASP